MSTRTLNLSALAKHLNLYRESAIYSGTYCIKALFVRATPGWPQV